MSPTVTPAQLLAAALDAAARGWPVFPVIPGAKRPALHGATSCPRTGACAGGHLGWEQRATTDPDRIRTAWTAGPAFNIGIPAGRAGLVVIDLDTAEDGEAPPPNWARLDITNGADVLAALAEQAGHLIPPTWTVATPTGGRHLYFAAPTGPGVPALRNTAGDRGGGLGWKIDTRAHGGYVLAAGSVTRTGTYTVTDGTEAAELPAWLLQRLRPAPIPPPPAAPVRVGTGRHDRYVTAAVTAETARVVGAAAGQRNACLYVAAVALGQLVAGGGLAEHDARAALTDAAARHIALRAYSAAQADKTITSGLCAGARRPRTTTPTTSPGAAA